MALAPLAALAAKKIERSASAANRPPLSRDCQPIPTFLSLIEYYCYDDDVVVVDDDDGNDHGVLNTSKQC